MDKEQTQKEKKKKTYNFSLFCLFVWIWDQTCYVAKAGVEHLVVLCPPPPKCWKYSYTPPCLILFLLSSWIITRSLWLWELTLLYWRVGCWPGLSQADQQEQEQLRSNQSMLTAWWVWVFAVFSRETSLNFWTFTDVKHCKETGEVPYFLSNSMEFLIHRQQAWEAAGRSEAN